MRKDGCRNHVNNRKLLCKDCRALPKDYVHDTYPRIPKRNVDDSISHDEQVRRYSDSSYYDQYQPFIPAFSVDQGLADTYLNYEPRHAENDSKPVESPDPSPVDPTPEPTPYYPSENSYSTDSSNYSGGQSYSSSSDSSSYDSGSSSSYDSGSSSYSSDY